MNRTSMTRRIFLGSTAVAACTLTVHAQDKDVLGQGDFKYRVVPNWGVLGEKTPVVASMSMICIPDVMIRMFSPCTSSNPT